MKASLIILATSVALALTGPLQKKAIVTDTVVELVITTIVPAPLTTTTYHQTTSQKNSPTSIATIKEQEAKNTQTVAEPAAKPSPSEVKDTADMSFEDTSVYHHNIHRSNHSAPDVSYDDTYAGYAAQTAKNCKFAHDV